VLAQAPGGLSCFLMPRFLPDGSVNALAFQRLKDKLGNRSNASSEVEFQAAHAWISARRAAAFHHHRDGDVHRARLRGRHRPG
jgi:alkylation response protein AidB-like acyl-CoA dehydrogenase